LQTLPPPRTAEDRAERAGLNNELAQLYIQTGAYDLAQERLASIEVRPGELGEDFLKSLTQRLGELGQRVDQVKDQVADLIIQNRASPGEKAAFERSQGAPGMAIRELEEANDAGGNPAGIRPLLVDLYCDTGQPDKAFDLIGSL